MLDLSPELSQVSVARDAGLALLPSDAGAAAGQRPMSPADLRSDHGHALQRRVEQLSLDARIALEHETENRCEHKQQRKTEKKPQYAT